MSYTTGNLRRAPWTGRAAQAQSGNRNSRNRQYAKFENPSRTGKQVLFARTAKGWLAVAEVVDDLLRKQVNSRKHKLRKPPGYAVEESVIEQAEALGVTRVELTERDTGRVLRAPLSAFRDKGIRIARGGFAPQLCLPIAKWSTGNAAQPAMLQV